MYKKVKSFMAAVLAVMMVISSCPVTAFADEGKTPWWKKITDTADEVKDTVVDTASDVTDTVVDATGNAIDSAKNYISSLSLPDFKNGWKTASKFFGSTVAGVTGQQYVNDVAEAINELQVSINTRVSPNGTNLASKAGYAAEEWHSGTYNIDAVASGSGKKAATPKSNTAGSVDIAVGDEVKAGLKYYSSGAESAKQQAKNYIQKYNEYASKTSNPKSMDDWLKENNFNFADDSDLYWSIYQDQVRVIPADQLEDAQKFLKEAIAKESKKEGANRQYVKSDYEETLKNLSDRIETSDGTSSIPLSKEDAETIAKAGMDNNFDPQEFGISTTNVIKGSYIAKQALKGGTTSAIIEAAVVIGPQLYEIIKYLVETGELDEEQLKETGLEGLSAAADGFLKGSISNALVIMCQAGKLGTAYTSASPELIGAMTVLVIDAIRFGIQMANGKMSQEDYIDLMAQELIVSAASLGSAALVSLIFPQAALAICLGSFVGGLVASAGYPAAKELVLAKIDEADVGLLVPIQSSAKSLKGKVSETSEKLSDALSGIKGIKKKNIPEITIKVFDFT